MIVISGVVVTPTDRVLPSSRSEKDLEGIPNISSTPDGERDEPVKVLEKQATFQEFVVWEHEVLPAADDPFIKGVEEWIQFAETVCVFFFYNYNYM
jgi:ribonuclease H2 subunit C